MIVLRYLRRPTLLSRRGYLMITAITWLLTLIWVGGIAALWIFWRTLPLYAKVGLTFVEALLTPTWRDLVQSYDGYVEELKKDGAS